jgi:hypothetical protein
VVSLTRDLIKKNQNADCSNLYSICSVVTVCCNSLCMKEFSRRLICDLVMSGGVAGVSCGRDKINETSGKNKMLFEKVGS